MFIIPLSPAFFANWFLTDGTTHSWCSAHLFSDLCFELCSRKFAVTHPTIMSTNSEIHPLSRTLVRLHSRFALILHDNFRTFWWAMRDAICQSLHTKETHLAFTRLEGAFSHVARSLTWFSIPVKADAVVEKRYPEINLEIMSPLIFVPVFLPLWLCHWYAIWL